MVREETNFPREKTKSSRLKNMNKDQTKIIKSCQAGNFEEFGRLYEIYSKKIYNFVYYRTSNKEEAEDLTSRIFIKALKGICGYNSEKGVFSSWLYRIAKNTVIDYYKTNKPTIGLTDLSYLANQDDLEKSFDNQEKLKQAKRYLQNLKPEQREIVLMRVWDGLSYKEIAEIMGKSEASCKMIFGRTIRRLRQEMPLEIFVFFLVLKIF